MNQFQNHMLNDPKKAGRMTYGLVSALYLATAVLLGLLLYFTIKNIPPDDTAAPQSHLSSPVSPPAPAQASILIPPEIV